MCRTLKRYGRRLLYRAGRRGIALAIFTATFATEGIGLVLGYKPTVLQALHLRIWIFGWMWIAVAMICFTGIFATNDKWHFALAVFAMAGWALLLVIYWQGAYGWASAVSWMTPCLLAVLISSWPEF